MKVIDSSHNLNTYMMKHLQLLTILFLSMIILSCEKDENNDNPQAQEEMFQALINGDNYSNYDFVLGVYQITKGTNGNTLSLDFADSNGEMITLFLNGTGGFETGTIKSMGNVDANSFQTYALVRQAQPQLSYFSSTGNVTITNHREHPTEAGARLISGNFTIEAASTDGLNTLVMSGSFLDLEYMD